MFKELSVFSVSGHTPPDMQLFAYSLQVGETLVILLVMFSPFNFPYSSFKILGSKKYSEIVCINYKKARWDKRKSWKRNGFHGAAVVIVGFIYCHQLV